MHEDLDMVAGDFKGACWRRKSRPDLHPDNTLEEAFTNAKIPVSPASSPLRGPGGIPSKWTDVCGFVKPPNSQSEWLHGHMEHSHRSARLSLSPKDHTSHHETWIYQWSNVDAINVIARKSWTLSG